MNEKWQQSRWLQQKMQEVITKKEKGVMSKKASLITLLIFLVIGLGMSVLGGKQWIPLSGMVCMMGILITLIMTFKKKTIHSDSNLKTAKRCINDMMLSDEELQLFDQEMLSAPLFAMELDKTHNALRITEHFVVSEFLNLGNPDCGICRRKDVFGMDYVKVRGGGSTTFENSYMVDLQDCYGKKIIGISIDSDARFIGLKRGLAQCMPQVFTNQSNAV